jgi:hypothetical protein
MPPSRRLADLEELLETNYQKLAKFQNRLDRTASIREEFDIEGDIPKIRKAIRDYEVEYWELLAQEARTCTVAEVDARNAIVEVVRTVELNKQPFYELAAALISQLEPELGKTDKTIKAKELAESIRQHGFTADVSAILKDNPGKRLLLVIDQFEELYTGCADTEQQQFVDALLAAVESASRAVTLVLTLRADFYSYVVNYPPFTEALNKYPAQNISLMKAEEMQAAIELPAQKMGVKLEEGLRQRILDDVKQEPGNLPLLEFALTQLWEKQSRGQLTHQAYSEIGGVAKALSDHAEAVYDKLSEQEKKQVQRIFLQLVRPGEGTEDTRRVATRKEVGEECWDLIRRKDGLADVRLVVTGRNEATGEETVEVVHEALIREWGTLREWMESDRTFRTWQEQLRAAKRQWEATGNDDGALLRGVLLAEAEDWRQKRLEELSEQERVFVQLSLALRDREEKDKEARRQQELKQQKDKTRLAISVAGLLIALLLVGGAAWQVSRQKQFLELSQEVVLGNVSSKTLPFLSSLMKEADSFRKRGQIDIALEYYRKILLYTEKLQEKITLSPKDFQNPEQDKKTIEKITLTVQQSLLNTILKERLPQIENDLNQGKIGGFKTKDELIEDRRRENPNFNPNSDIRFNYNNRENNYKDGALRKTYSVLRGKFGFGADVNENGLIDEREASRIPCEALKEIEAIWRRHTNCGWYGSNDKYTEPKCKKLDGQSLTVVVFDRPYEIAIKRIDECKTGITNTIKQ